MDGRGRSVAGSVAVVLIGLAFLAPLVLVLRGSFLPVGLPPPRADELLAAGWSFEGYRELASLLPLGTPLLNSLLVAAVAVPLGVVVASWAGFAAARLPSSQGAFLVACTVIALLVPVTSLLVGRLTVFRWAGLTDTLAPLMATGLIGVSPVFVLVFAWAYRRLPDELFDIATEFGLSPLAAWRRVALPMTRGVTGAVAAVAFLLTWSDYLGPMVYLSDQRRATIPLAIGTLASLDGPNQPIMLAGAVVAIVPVVVVVALVARRIPTGGEHR